jgi:hypothetical protein
LVGVALIGDEHRLRWFWHIQRRPPEAPVNSGILKSLKNNRKGRGQPKLTLMEAVLRDLKDWNVLAIWLLIGPCGRILVYSFFCGENLSLLVPCLLIFCSPRVGFLMFLLGFMSSLPQLAWEKGSLGDVYFCLFMFLP